MLLMPSASSTPIQAKAEARKETSRAWAEEKAEMQKHIAELQDIISKMQTADSVSYDSKGCFRLLIVQSVPDL